MLAGALLLASSLLVIFALRGPVPPYAAIASAALGDATARVMIGASLLAPLALGAAIAVREAGALRGIAGAIAGIIVCCAILVGPHPARTIIEVNEVFRVGPSILGGAGIGVGDVATARIGR
jgi:hypothetical protein